MRIPHDEGVSDPRRRLPSPRRDWLVGAILVGIGLLMLTGVIDAGFGRLTSSPYFPWFLIAVGIGVPVLLRRARSGRG